MFAARKSVFSSVNEFFLCGLMTVLGKICGCCEWRLGASGLGWSGLEAAEESRPIFFELLDCLLEDWRSFVKISSRTSESSSRMRSVSLSSPQAKSRRGSMMNFLSLWSMSLRMSFICGVIGLQPVWLQFSQFAPLFLWPRPKHSSQGSLCAPMACSKELLNLGRFSSRNL